MKVDLNKVLLGIDGRPLIFINNETGGNVAEGSLTLRKVFVKGILTDEPGQDIKKLRRRYLFAKNCTEKEEIELTESEKEELLMLLPKVFNTLVCGQVLEIIENDND